MAYPKCKDCGELHEYYKCGVKVKPMNQENKEECHCWESGENKSTVPCSHGVIVGTQETPEWEKEFDRKFSSFLVRETGPSFTKDIRDYIEFVRNQTLEEAAREIQIQTGPPGSLTDGLTIQRAVATIRSLKS